MEKVTPYLGILLIIIGTLVLIVTRFSTLGSHNLLLITGLLYIVAGIWFHIRSIKRDSRF